MKRIPAWAWRSRYVSIISSNIQTIETYKWDPAGSVKKQAHHDKVNGSHLPSARAPTHGTFAWFSHLPATRHKFIVEKGCGKNMNTTIQTRYFAFYPRVETLVLKTVSTITAASWPRNKKSDEGLEDSWSDTYMWKDTQGIRVQPEHYNINCQISK